MPIGDHGVELREYQQQALEKAIKNEKGFMNNETMGKGKTITTIFTANRLIKDRGFKSIVIVCPANVKRVWEQNMTHFETDDITIYSYNKIAVNYIQFDCDVLILDESHRLKNPTSKTAKKLMLSKWKYSFCLTGTPIEKAYIDLWSQIRFIDSNLLGNYWYFLNKYCVVDQYNRIIGYKQHMLPELLEKLKQYMFISNIDEVKEYNVKRVNIDYQLSDQNKQLIDTLLTSMELLDPEYIFITTAATKQKIVQHIASGRYFENTDMIIKLNNIVNKHKNVIMLYNFNCERDILKKHFKNSYEYSSEVKQFEEYLINGGILIAQISSIGEGTDGLQNISSCIVFTSLNWSYRLNIQAQKRIDRIGQTEDCTIYYLINDTEIDLLVIKALEQKKSLSVKTLKQIEES